MSLLTFDQLTTGTTFIVNQPMGFVTYTVLGRIGSGTVLAQLIDPVGNDIMFDQPRFNAMLKLGKHFFDSIESAKAFETDQEEQRLAQTIQNFANDQDAFIEYVLKHVYQDDSDPEVAEIVKHVTAVHRPRSTA